MRRRLFGMALALCVVVGFAPATSATGAVVTLDPTTDPLPAAQAQLSAYGYTIDPIGMFGAYTERAIRHWQRANGLPVTGMLDAATLQRLGIGATVAAPAGPPPSIPVAQVVPAGNWHCPQYVPLLVQYNLPVAFFDRVMWRESKCNPNAYNGRRRDRSHGLLQINMKGSLGPDRMERCNLTAWSDLFDPATNISCAAQLYAIAGRRPWGG